MTPRARNVLVLALAALAFFAVTGLRNTFGPGKVTPELQSQINRQQGYDYGTRLRAEHAAAGVLVRDVEKLARELLDRANIGAGGNAEAWRAGFISGYAEAGKNPNGDSAQRTVEHP